MTTTRILSTIRLSLYKILSLLCGCQRKNRVASLFKANYLGWYTRYVDSVK